MKRRNEGIRDKGPRLFTRLKPIFQARDATTLAKRFTLMLQPWDTSVALGTCEEDYKYQYNVIAQSKDDPVITAIRKTIASLRRDHVVFANAHVRVHPATAAPPIWPRNVRDPNYTIKFYTFIQEGLEFPLTVSITVSQYSGHLIKDSILVRVSQKWMPLKEWLLTIPHPDAGKEKTTFQMTRTFWYRNGRVFRFLDLPPSVRDIVYGCLIDHEIYPLPIQDFDEDCNPTTTNVVFGAGYTRNLTDSRAYKNLRLDDFVHEARKAVRKPSLAILQTCKQVHQEALKIGWNSSIKCFNDDTLFVTIAKATVGPMSQFNCLNKIQLNFTFRQWFRFFGVALDAGIHFENTKPNAVLLHKENLPKLRHLEMRFRSPEDGTMGNPWREFVDEGSYFDCCQVDMVDMVCTFAFVHVSWIGSVKLEGYVKTASKDKWEHIFDHERRGLRHDHDQEAAIQALLHAPDDLLPPPCSCSESCATRELSRWRTETGFNESRCRRLNTDDYFKYDELENHPLSKFALWQAAYEAQWRQEQDSQEYGDETNDVPNAGVNEA